MRLLPYTNIGRLQILTRGTRQTYRVERPPPAAPRLNVKIGAVSDPKITRKLLVYYNKITTSLESKCPSIKADNCVLCQKSRNVIQSDFTKWAGESSSNLPLTNIYKFVHSLSYIHHARLPLNLLRLLRAPRHDYYSKIR